MDLFRGFQTNVQVDEAGEEAVSIVGQDVDSEGETELESVLPNPRVGLINLPNEILLHILDFLDDESLFPLASLSRYLHHLALPLYLSRKGFGQRPDDQLVLFNYNSRDILKALHISLFRPSLFRLYYPIDCGKSADELDREIGILRDVVGNLTTLQEVVISFQNAAPVAPGEIPDINPIAPINPGDLFSPVNQNYGLPDGFNGPFLLSLFDAIISSGCKSFVIRHCGPQTPALQGIHAVALRNFSGMRGWSRTFVRSLQLLSDTFSYSRRPVKNSELGTFHIHSPMAFHSVLCRWTIETLNTSAIASLSLSRQHYVDKQSWFLILPFIQIPTLTDLSIDFCAIDTSDLIKFLQRHSRLEKLGLGHNFKLQRHAPPFPKTALIQLTHLTAPPKWINHLLATAGSLPSLFSTTILVWVPNTHLFKLSDLDRSLEPSISRLVAMRDVRHSLSFGSASGSWIAPTITPPTFDPLEELDLGDGSGDRAEQSPARAAAAATAHRLITHMELCIKVHSLPFALTAKLPKWLAQFPNLKRLDLLTMSGAAAPAAAGLSSSCLLIAKRLSAPSWRRVPSLIVLSLGESKICIEHLEKIILYMWLVLLTVSCMHCLAYPHCQHRSCIISSHECPGAEVPIQLFIFGHTQPGPF
ncbi:hypothetical protein M413DRAFT_114186 [Hebeloma cylindrosporum]|uniref:F-box domain-containing protein n=1 Tax=Hebeloma cylindrosporum TaxID=76867 RepID=A0A0C2Z972_HEBCY|nr:hypothetical protein M413DRAFT_114186 [Hebeloma cylindrosporum h7]